MLGQRKNPITYLARTTFRNERRPFGIRGHDRRSHVYMIGATGTGKSTLIETMIWQDLARGQGLTLVDSHGDLALQVVSSLPEARRHDLIYLDLARPTAGASWNPIGRVVPRIRPLVASQVLTALKHIWIDSWGPRMEHILRHALLTVLDQPEATLADIVRLLDDPKYRETAVLRVSNAQVRRFWLQEFAKYPANLRAEAIAPIQNKVGAFLAHPTLQRLLLVSQGTIDLPRVMDESRVLVVNLARGEVGADAAALMGALLVSIHGAAALARASTPAAERRDFGLYLDEFPGYTGSGLAGMLAELRKYRLALVLAAQTLAQLTPETRDAILGNVGTIIAFRVSGADAEILTPHFAPTFAPEDLVNLPNRHALVRLLVDGVVSRPFSAETITALEANDLVASLPRYR